MAETFQYDVFFSYGSKDKPEACDLAEWLKSNGMRVWFAEWELRAFVWETRRQKKIEQALKQSRVLVLFLSGSITPAEQEVFEHYINLFRVANSQRSIICLHLDDSKIEETFKASDQLDWREKSIEAYEQLLSLCRSAESRVQISSGIELSANYNTLGFNTYRNWCVALSRDGQTAFSGSFADGLARVWDVENCYCLAVFRGHTAGILSVALSGDGRLALSGSLDRTIRVWHVENRRCLATLRGHPSGVESVALSNDGRLAVSASDYQIALWDIENSSLLAMLIDPTARMVKVNSVSLNDDGRLAVSGFEDNKVRVWDTEQRRCMVTLKGHTASVLSVALSNDGRLAVSGSEDNTVRVWDIENCCCIATLEGHTGKVDSVSLSGDGRLAASGSEDQTVRIWDVETGQCVEVLEGHTKIVHSVALSGDGQVAVSAASGQIYRWPLKRIEDAPAYSPPQSISYTNAKIVLVGDTGVGKTGLAIRLCENRWEVTESTHGMLISRLELTSGKNPADVHREAWVWDFAGQPDYRLIHQLYMDETALGILVFDPQDNNPFEGITYWDKALHTKGATIGNAPVKLLVAARCDRGGIMVSESQVNQFCMEHNFAGFFQTGAKMGQGCAELKAAIAAAIPWDQLPYISTTRLFKFLKDALLRLKEQDITLIRLSDLCQRLQLMTPGEMINSETLRAVVRLMQGQGVVQMLDFGDFVLLQPEYVNRYASVIVRVAREHIDEMGCVLEQQVLAGQLDYKDMARLNDVDEKILLHAIVQTFLDRALCLREATPTGTMLVFPSYFRRDRPEVPEYPNIFVAYGFAGLLDEIYATLVVRLSYSELFKKDQLWKDAADFRTHEGKRVGIALRHKSDGRAELIVYFEPGVPDDTKVTFIKYVHEHLMSRAHDVTRVRAYVCPHCHTPLRDRKAIELRLNKGLKDIICVVCEKRLPLIDLIEEKFASDEFLQRVRELDKRARINLDNESLEMILIGHTFAIVGEAGQIFRPTPNSDWGIDGEIEFKNEKGEASGKRIYLQLKSGDSYLNERKADGKEIFRIKNLRHIKYWQAQAYPVMLVIRTSDGQIRWMDVSTYLCQQQTSTPQIVFEGEPFTSLNVLKLKDRLFS